MDEPKTPYSETTDEFEPGDELDANILAAKLAASMNRPPRCLDDDEDEHENETEEEKKRRLDFEKKRKHHYNEFQVRLVLLLV